MRLSLLGLSALAVGCAAAAPRLAPGKLAKVEAAVLGIVDAKKAAGVGRPAWPRCYET